jgi:hypothetical protein
MKGRFISILVVFLVSLAAFVSTVAVVEANPLALASPVRHTQVQAPQPTMTLLQGPQPTLTLNPISGPAGTVVTGSGWPLNTVVDIRFNSTMISIVKPTVASDGTFTATFTVPQGAVVGPKNIDADEEATPQSVATTFTVTPLSVPVPPPSPTPSPGGCTLKLYPSMTIHCDFTNNEVLPLFYSPAAVRGESWLLRLPQQFLPDPACW